MVYRIAADAVLLVHGLFVLYAVCGAALVLRWAWTLVLHLPAVLWAGWVELGGRVCPLTPLEQQLRLLAGEAGYSGGFLQHYLFALLYPDGLTRTQQIGLGIGVLALNAALYAAFLLQRRRNQM